MAPPSKRVRHEEPPEAASKAVTGVTFFHSSPESFGGVVQLTADMVATASAKFKRIIDGEDGVVACHDMQDELNRNGGDKLTHADVDAFAAWLLTCTDVGFVDVRAQGHDEDAYGEELASWAADFRCRGVPSFSAAWVPLAVNMQVVLGDVRRDPTAPMHTVVVVCRA